MGLFSSQYGAKIFAINDSSTEWKYGWKYATSVDGDGQKWVWATYGIKVW